MGEGLNGGFGSPSLWGLALACLLAGMLGLWAALVTRPPSETEAILRAARLYQDETGGPLTDCHARPAQLADLWIIVTCIPQNARQTGEGRIYPFDHRGRLVRMGDALLRRAG